MKLGPRCLESVGMTSLYTALVSLYTALVRSENFSLTLKARRVTSTLSKYQVEFQSNCLQVKLMICCRYAVVWSP